MGFVEDELREPQWSQGKGGLSSVTGEDRSGKRTIVGSNRNDNRGSCPQRAGAPSV